MKGGWRWFFGVLAVLSAFAITAPIVYNLGLQLTAEQIAAARALWAQNGPADYDLEYLERIDGATEGTAYSIKVRGGLVVAASADGQTLPTAEWNQHSVTALLAHIQRQFDADQQNPGRKNYASAFFDKKTGYPIRYVHRVRGSKTRLEWNVKLLPPNAGTAELR